MFRISVHDRETLRRWSRSRTLAARVVLRSRIILALGEGDGVTAVADALGIAPATVRLWRRRFEEHGPAGLQHDAPGRGRKPALDFATRQGLRKALDVVGSPTQREHTRELGVSAATVSRWRRRSE